MSAKNDGGRATKDKDKATDKDVTTASAGTGPDGDGPMKRKEYERQLRRLHAELVAMQEWVKSSGAKVCVVFEGRDTVGRVGPSRPSPSG